MKRLPDDQEKKRADEARQLRAWRTEHQAELDAALAGKHGVLVAALLKLLGQLELNAAATLLEFMQQADWESVSYETRLVVLHQVGEAIASLRERHGLAPFDDPLPPRLNVFLHVKEMRFPPLPACAGSSSSAVATQSVPGRGVTATVPK